MRFLTYGAKNKVVRFFPLVLSMCILCVLLTLPSTVSAAASGDELVDIKSHWAETVIRKWVSQGLAKGYGDGRFGPNDSITRAEFVTLLNRIFGYERMSNKSFPDVKAGAWYAGEIAKAYQTGIISGDNKGNMNPEAVISRQEAVVILTRAFSLTGDHLDAALKYVDLNQIADWALGSVGIMTKKGYVTGRPGNLFAPKDNLSRAEAVKMIDNVMGELINVTGTFTRVVPGNMVVSTSGVTLKDTYIAGDLYLTEGIGSSTIQLIDVEIKGRTITAEGIDVKNLLVGTNTEQGNTQGQATPKPTSKPSTQPTGVPGSTTPTTAPGSSTPSTPGTETQPTTAPTPTQGPTAVPTQSPTATPTQSPTTAPTPTPTPTQGPTITPTTTPTPDAGYKLTINAMNGYVMVNPEKDVYAPGETVELITRPKTGYSFRSWSGDISGNRLRETIEMDGNKSVTAVFNTWTPPIGISAPEFGIFETYRMYDDTAKRNPELTYHQNTEGGYYTHYVDNTSPNATDSNNPNGTADKPRKTIPKSNIPTGSVIEIHGGPYIIGQTIITAQGSPDQPIFLRGYSETDKPLITYGDLYINSQYMIIENIRRMDRGIIARSFADKPAHHIAVRNCEVHNAPNGISAVSYDDGWPVTDVVIYNNYVHLDNFDPDAGEFPEDDETGVYIQRHSERVWVLDNLFHTIKGDAVGGGHAVNYTARNYYVGRNIMHTCGENAVDIKEVDTVILSQNIMYNFKGWSSGGTIGGATVFHYGPTHSPKNVWFIFNEIFDCEIGIQVGGGQTYPIYFIGNIIHDVKNESSPGTGKGFQTWSCKEVYMTGNVFYDVENGIDWGVSTSEALLVFEDNIIANVAEGGYHLKVNVTAQQQKSIIENNLFYQPGGETRINWGGKQYILSDWQTNTGKGLTCIEGDPLFTNATADFHLQTGSPAIDKTDESDLYQLFFDTYGLDIRCDKDGVSRPQGSAWDIGAYEYIAANEEIFIADTARGADTGVDVNNAHGLDWVNNSANWGEGAGKISAGDTLRLSGVMTKPLYLTGSGTEDKPITVTFLSGARFSAPTWASDSSIITVRGAHIIIDGGENGVIEATDNGTALTHHNHFRGVRIEGSNHVEVKNLTIHNLYVRTPDSDDYYPYGAAIYIDKPDTISIHHNTITECRTAISGAYRASSKDLTIYSNNITRVSNGIFVGSAGPNSSLDGLVIHDNRMIDFFNWDGQWDPKVGGGDGHHHSDGVQISALHTNTYVDNVRIYNNVIGGDIGSFFNAVLYLEDDIRTTEIFNNVLYTTGDGYPHNGFIAGGNPARVYNNTIAASTKAIGIICGGAQTQVFNNILYNVSYGISTREGNMIGMCDYNLYLFKADREMYVRPKVYKYDSWRLAFGYDEHSIVADPLFVNVTDADFRIAADSPAVNAGVRFEWLADNDIIKTPRPQEAIPDIGAYEYVPGK